MAAHAVLRVQALPPAELPGLLARYGLELVLHPGDAAIEGSFWGAPEAGIVGRRVHARGDTPVHSVLHEAAHVICMSRARRDCLHTDAGGDDLEEAAVCYLQVILAGELPSVGARRLQRDMDDWGYSFRLGSTRRWFEEDADDARNWLIENDLLERCGKLTWRLREAGV